MKFTPSREYEEWNERIVDLIGQPVPIRFMQGDHQ